VTITAMLIKKDIFEIYDPLHLETNLFQENIPWLL
jgi:hypothetical protein